MGHCNCGTCEACARDYLRPLLPVGSSVAIVEVRRGRDGASGDYVVIAAHPDGTPRDITADVAAACGMQRAKSGAVRVGGGGVDRTMLLCCNLSRALHGDDYAVNRIRI
jgi:hypothetical protein